MEWARLNPGYIPAFILQMQKNSIFLGWFKSYYDTLRLMYKRLVELDLPFIPELEDEFRNNFTNQAKIERVKYEESVVITEDRREQVRWFNDNLAHMDMLDRGCLLNRLPQMTMRKTVRRNRSRSRSASRVNSKKFKLLKSTEVIQVEILTKDPKAPVPLKQFTFQSQPTTKNNEIESRDKVFPRTRPHLTEGNISRDKLSHRSIIARSPEPTPGPSNAADGSPVCRITPIIYRKGGRTTEVSVDEYLEGQLAKGSSEDEDFQFVVPPELLD